MPMMRRPGATPGSPEVPTGQEPAAPDTVPALQVPADTTPTWELEMLVSGAVLVGLFQLPPLVWGAWLAFIPGSSTHSAYMLATLGFSLVQALVYSLIASFVVHLSARAYWVALVGLDSVFPEGIRWERVTRSRVVNDEELRQLVRPLPGLISRLDNFCSVVFGFGFLAASLGVVSLAFLGLAVAVLWLLALAGAVEDPSPFGIMAVMLVLVVVPRLLGGLVLPRLQPGGRVDRALRAVLRFSAEMLLLRWFGALRLTLMSNVRRGVVLATALTLLLGSWGLALSRMIGSRGDAEAYAGLPASLGAAATQYLSYADQRNGSDVFVPQPFIQSDVIRDPYVRLFIPYVPRRDGAELRACRAAAPVATAPDGVAVACLLAIHAVTLDGRPLAQAGQFYTDATSRMQGLRILVPVAGLAQGRHVLTVRQPAPPDDPGARPGLSTIPFWL